MSPTYRDPRKLKQGRVGDLYISKRLLSKWGTRKRIEKGTTIEKKYPFAKTSDEEDELQPLCTSDSPLGE